MAGKEVKKPKERKLLRTFISIVARQSFSVPLMGNVVCPVCNGTGDIWGKTCEECNGKKRIYGRKPKLTTSGQPAYIGNKPIYLDRLEHFVNIQKSNSRGNYAKYDVYDDTPKEVVEQLEHLASVNGIDTVWTQEYHDEQANPERFAEIKKRKAVEAELAKVKAEGNASKEKLKEVIAESEKQGDIIEEMRKRVKDAETAAGKKK